MLLKQVNRYNITLKLAVAIVVASSYLALTAVRSYGSIVLFIPIIPLFLNFFVERIVERFPRYSTYIQIPLWIVSISLPVLIMTIGILDTVLLLTAIIQLTLMVRKKGLKEYLYIILMSFFLLLGAGVQAPEFIVGISLLLFICFVFVLLPLVTMTYTKEDVVSNKRVLQGRIKFSSYGAYIFIVVLLNITLGWFLIVVSFLFMPRLEAGIFGRDIGNVTRSGISTTVSLKGGQSIEISYTPVMSVHIPSAGANPPIPENRLYWRITSLPTYLGVQWRRWPLEESYEMSGTVVSFISLLRSIEQQKRSAQKRLKLEQVRELSSKPVVQEIYLDQIPEDGVPVLDRVREFRTKDTGSRVLLGWDMTKDYTVTVTTNNVRRMVYTVISDLVEWDGDKLKEASSNYKELMSPRDYDLLTQHDLSPEVQARIQSVVSGKETVYEKVKAIEEWLSGAEFQYTLDIPPLPGEHPMNAFFMQIRRGHCELFASAMALAVRSLGIPARVVSGYVGGEWDSENRSYLVREGMAHLWVEVLFPEYGWVPFDPSPMPDSNYFMRNQLVRRLTRWVLQTRMFWYQRIIGFDQGYQLPNFGFKSVGFIRNIDDYINPGKKLPVPSVGSVFALLILLLLIYFIEFIWGVLKRLVRIQKVTVRKVSLAKDQRDAMKLFKKMESIFKRNNWKVSHLTVEEIMEELPKKLPLLCSDVQAFLDEYNYVRFGLKPWDTERKHYWYRTIRKWKNKKFWVRKESG